MSKNLFLIDPDEGAMKIVEVISGEVESVPGGQLHTIRVQYFERRKETMNEAQQRVMDRSHELWDRKRKETENANQALTNLANVIFEEYTTVRAATKEAAYGMVKDYLEQYGEVGQEILNRLYVKEVM